MSKIYKGTLGLIGNTPLVEVVNIEKELNSSVNMLTIIFDEKYPGEWNVKSGKLYKGSMEINNDFKVVDEVKDKYINELNLIALENSIKFNIGFSKLSNSDVVETMEDKKASIDTLSATNAVAYRIFNKKIDDLYLDVKTHLESVIGEK